MATEDLGYGEGELIFEFLDSYILAVNLGGEVSIVFSPYQIQDHRQETLLVTTWDCKEP